MAVVPFELVDGLALVPAIVWGPRGDGRKFRFVLDTGTARTMLSHENLPGGAVLRRLGPWLSG